MTTSEYDSAIISFASPLAAHSHTSYYSVKPNSGQLKQMLVKMDVEKKDNR